MTVVIVHRDEAPVAAIGVRDELRPEVPRWSARSRIRASA
jgi:cation transport ATPase